MSLLTPFKDVTPTLNNLAPFYYGIVEDNNDPLGLQRIKVRIKELFGDIKTSNLPWCIKDNCAGNSNSSGFICTPSIGQIVKVSFDCGDIYSPKYSNGFINQVPTSMSGSDTSGFIDNLNNYFKFNKEGIEIADKNGNSILMTTNGIIITDKNSNSITMNSSGVTINGNNLIKLDSITTQITGNELVSGNTAIAGTMHSVNYDAHTHTSSAPGDPTSTPDQ